MRMKILALVVVLFVVPLLCLGSTININAAAVDLQKHPVTLVNSDVLLRTTGMVSDFILALTNLNHFYIFETIAEIGMKNQNNLILKTTEDIEVPLAKNVCVLTENRILKQAHNYSQIITGTVLNTTIEDFVSVKFEDDFNKAIYNIESARRSSIAQKRPITTKFN